MQISKEENQFNFGLYDVIGFDLDCTLLRYNIESLVSMIYRELQNYLVNKKCYPKEVLDKPLKWEFIQKGLIIDSERGNIVKIGYDSSVIKGSHGTRMLSEKDLDEIYGKERHWDIAKEFVEDPLSTWNGPSSEKMRAALDYFDLSVPLIFAHVVDSIDSKSSDSKKNYLRNWLDINEGLFYLFSKDNFKDDTSPFFGFIKQNPEHYLRKTDESVICHLKNLRKNGKVVFLLTGSDIDYANFIASYALGKNWQQLFDCSIGFAKKPGFFFKNRQFYKVENSIGKPEELIPLDENLQLNKTYCGGNWPQLLKAFARKLSKEPKDLRCLHLGDNVIQDIHTPVSAKQMDALLICEELLENDETHESHKAISSSVWGSIFEANGKPTFFRHIACNYTKNIVPTIDCITKIPLDYN